jgi:glutamate synthase (NADPH) large chain
MLPGETGKQQHLDLSPLLGSDLIAGRQAAVLPGGEQSAFDPGLLAEKW